MQVTITRFKTGKDGTFGIINVDHRFACMTLELPDKYNQRNISCIPAGKYSIVPHQSPKFGKVYKVLNVPNRGDILFHIGNYLEDTNGCLLLGLYRKSLMISQSRKAFEYFYKMLNWQPATLTIKEDYGFEFPT